MFSRPLFAASLTVVIVDGYMYEGGVINMKRLQVALDEMTHREQGVLEKEYHDFKNFHKGKEAEHVEEMGRNGRS